MTFKDLDQYSFHGEWVPLSDGVTKEQAERWLQEWKRFFIEKHKCELIDEQLVHQAHLNTLGIKIQVKMLNKT